MKLLSRHTPTLPPKLSCTRTARGRIPAQDRYEGVDPCPAGGGTGTGGSSSGTGGTGGTGPGNGTAAGAVSDDEGGCGCRTAAPTTTPDRIGLLTLLGLATMVRRRRRHRGPESHRVLQQEALRRK